MNSLFLQLVRFGIVGLTAATVHFTIVICLVEMSGLKPLVANVFAFFISFQVSYSGHRFWTFKDTIAQHRVALPKLLFLQLGNLAANESFFYVCLKFLNIPYPMALLIVLATLPIITFIVSKLWIFR